jgi:hypothetical protein
LTTNLAAEVSRATAAEALKANTAALGSAAYTDSAAYATAAQGTTADSTASAITAQVFAAVALTNPYSAATPLTPRYIGDIAVNSTTLEVWQAQASAAAATSWSCVSRGFYNGVVLTDAHAFNSNGWFSALSTASNMPAAENCLFSQKNSNLGTTSAFLMGVGLTSFKLYFQQKSASTWGAWSTGVTAAEIGCLSGVTSAIQTQLNAKAALVDGKVPDSQLSTKALRSRVQGDVCVATFGDSTAQAVFTSGVTDMGNYVVAFPESGATTVNTGRYFTVGGLGRYRLVGDGGIPGTEVVSFLNRSKSAYSATRRALPDIIATRPDVVLWHGGSVNNITALTSYSSGVVASMIDFHCRGVKILTEAGIDVIDSGILGISIDDAYAGVRRQTLLEVNAGLAALAAEDPLWHWLEPNGLMHDGTGAFYSDYCDPDGVHPNYLGCYILGLAESEIIESLFYASLPSAVRYDFQPDFANASATVPAKMLRSFSTATINSTVCHEDLYTVNLTTSGSTLIQLTLGYADIKGSVLLGASSGSRFLMHTRAWVENSDGSLLAGVYGLASATFTDATNAKSVTWVNRTYNSGRDLVTKFALPCDAADLGTGSYFLLMSLTIPSAGTYNFKMTPPRIFSE